MTEHEAVIWFEEQQAQPGTIIILTATPECATLAIQVDGINYIVATRTAIDLRLIELVTLMQAKLAAHGVTA